MVSPAPTVEPVPSCPSSDLPWHVTDPSVFTAQTCPSPTAYDATSASPIAVGVAP